MSDQPKILVVEDEEWAREFLVEVLIEEGFEVEGAGDGVEALNKISMEVYDLIITDLRMHGVGGLEVLKAAKDVEIDPEVLLITAYGSIESAVEALKLGAFDYLAKPLDAERVLVSVRQALEKRKLRTEIARLRSQVSELSGKKSLVAASGKMRKVLELVDLVSISDTNVLIEGESGTGKELVARAIHMGSSRKDHAFIAVNCGALPEPLLESELFGHEKGAFTGALRSKKGLFEEADGGSLLLDEVGDMPLPLQIKLLRVLQDGQVRRVGSNATEQLDVRIIAATNRNLSSLVEEGRLREDLYYRLKVVPINIPPLRERRDDIMPLLNHFLQKLQAKFPREIKGFDEEAIRLLLEHNWPGNIRELENLVEGASTLSSSAIISISTVRSILNIEDILPAAPKNNGDPESLNLVDAHEQIEKQYIEMALEQASWNQMEACKSLGIGRTSLWRKMEKYQIEKPSP